MNGSHIRTILASALLAKLFASSEARAGNGVWTTHGPGGGEIQGIAIDPLATRIVYATTSGGGVFKSEDAGDHWSAANDGLESAFINSLVIDPSLPTTLYTATPGSGVFRSVDRARSWTAVNQGLADQNVHALVADPRFTGTIYAASATGIFRTTDSGETWSRTLSASVFSLVIDPFANALYAAAGSGIFKSADSGSSWTFVAAVGLTGSVVGLAADASNGTLYANTAALGAGQKSGIFRSTDGGSTWTKLPVSAFLVATDPVTPNKVYSAGDFLYSSLNGGNSWTPRRSPLPSLATALAITPLAPQIVYVGTQIGLFRTGDEGFNWIESSRGLIASSVSSVAIDPVHKETVYAGANTAVEKSEDGGEHWSPTGAGPQNAESIAIDPANSATVYAGTTGSGIWKTIDGGGSWTSLSAGLPDDPQFYTVRQIAIDPVLSETVYAVIGRVLRSTDGGRSWTILGNGLAGQPVSGLAIDRSNSSTLYAATDGAVFKSDDSGNTWNLVAQIPSVRALTVDSSDSKRIYGYGNGVFVSEDSGRTWQPAGLGLENITDLIATPAGLYASTSSNGVFWSVDRGAHWAPVVAGLLNKFVTSIAADATGLFLHAGSFGGGVYDLRLDARISLPVSEPMRPSTRSLDPRR